MKVINLFKNENELIKQAKKQNNKAQYKLYSKYAPKMLSVCRMYTKDTQYAEDVMVTGFTKVFKHINKYNNKGSFEGWIRRIMINESINFIRTKKEIVLVDTWHDNQQHACSNLNNLETQDIQNLIDQLPPGYRAVFNLYIIEGYKHHEIAKLLNISEGTSKSQLSHARKLLQKQLNQLNNFKNDAK